jgi:hypothetical protein
VSEIVNKRGNSGIESGRYTSKAIIDEGERAKGEIDQSYAQSKSFPTQM